MSGFYLIIKNNDETKFHQNVTFDASVTSCEKS